jgi:hypothetical protein
MTVTRGRDYQAFECRTCHFVIIEAPQPPLLQQNGKEVGRGKSDQEPA